MKWDVSLWAHPGLEAAVSLEVQAHTSTKGSRPERWWDSEFISRVPELPQGLLFKGKLVCLQLDPWATFDSCSKNNKTDGQNRFWGLHPNCHPQWNLKEAKTRWEPLPLTIVFCLRHPRTRTFSQKVTVVIMLFLLRRVQLGWEKISRMCVSFTFLKW